MAETIQSNGLWHVILVEEDLINQAGLKAKDFEQDFGFFKYKKRGVIISHIYNKHMVVSMEGKEDSDLKELMNGLSKVVEYNPFCKYNLINKKDNQKIALPTYEWDKVNPEERYKELIDKQNIENLAKI